jgi:riboflavin biosynthesis pyrimidine reductase
MRVLVGPDVPLSELYAAPADPWLRVNMVSTVDGAATGDNGTSRSINNAADKVVFDLLRSQADVLVVGAGTLRDEGYGHNRLPIVAVSRSGKVPPTLADSEPGKLLLATTGNAEGLGSAREQLGEENVLVLGSHHVDLAALRAMLVGRGLTRILSEGGPHLLRDLLAQGCADEVCVTTVPRMIGGGNPRISDGPPIDAHLTLHAMVEEEGTLMARWLVSR